MSIGQDEWWSNELPVMEILREGEEGWVMRFEGEEQGIPC